MTQQIKQPLSIVENVSQAMCSTLREMLIPLSFASCTAAGWPIQADASADQGARPDQIRLEDEGRMLGRNLVWPRSNVVHDSDRRDCVPRAMNSAGPNGPLTSDSQGGASDFIRADNRIEYSLAEWFSANHCGAPRRGVQTDEHQSNRERNIKYKECSSLPLHNRHFSIGVNRVTTKLIVATYSGVPVAQNHNSLTVVPFGPVSFKEPLVKTACSANGDKDRDGVERGWPIGDVFHVYNRRAGIEYYRRMGVPVCYRRDGSEECRRPVSPDERQSEGAAVR